MDGFARATAAVAAACFRAGSTATRARPGDGRPGSRFPAAAAGSRSRRYGLGRSAGGQDGGRTAAAAPGIAAAPKLPGPPQTARKGLRLSSVHRCRPLEAAPSNGDQPVAVATRTRGCAGGLALAFDQG